MVNNIWQTLYDRAAAVQCPRKLSPLMEVGSVGAAILTDRGNIYTGVCIDSACGMGMCAERNAIANMLSCGENKITKVVAVMPDGSTGTPCGVCREFMMQLGQASADIEILLSLEPLKTVKLGEQLPDWWGKTYLDAAESPIELNIFNGDHALNLWKKCNFSGDCLVWRETYLEGPLPVTDDLHIFRSARAEYLAHFEEIADIGTEKLYRHLQKMDDTVLNLSAAAKLILWFDSCIFDQTLLMRILYLLNSKRTAIPEVFLYCSSSNCLQTEDFQPGIAGKIRLLQADLELAAKAWNAFISKNSSNMTQLAAKESFVRMPAMKKALQRCAEEIPDQNQLTRTQRQIMQIVAGKNCSFMEIFKGLDSFEEYPFLSDTACQRQLDDLVKKKFLTISRKKRYSIKQ